MQYDITLKYRPQFLREMQQEDLEELIVEAQERFWELRVQTSPHGRVKDVPKPDLFKKVKRDIARIKTVLNEIERC